MSTPKKAAKSKSKIKIKDLKPVKSVKGGNFPSTSSTGAVITIGSPITHK
jgi:hypothetical protein